MFLREFTLAAFACLALAASQSSVDCHDQAVLLQAKGTKRVLQRSSTHGTNSSNNENTEAAITSLQEFKEKVEEEIPKQKHTVDVGTITDIAQKAATTIQCLQGGCSEAATASSALSLLSAGFAAADVLPGIQLVANLGEIALSVFFPVKDKKSPPPLSLLDIKNAISEELTDWDEVKISQFEFPSIGGAIGTMIRQFSYALKDSSRADFKEFHKALRGYGNEVLGWKQQLNTGWNEIVNSGGWLQSHTSSSVTLNSNCQNTCSSDPNIKWVDKSCGSDLNKFNRTFAALQNAASKLRSVSRATALLLAVGHGIYIHFNHTSDFYLQALQIASDPIIKTSSKVDRNIQNISGFCGDVLNQVPDRYPVFRSTDCDHYSCSDNRYGAGWVEVGSVQPVISLDYSFGEQKSACETQVSGIGPSNLAGILCSQIFDQMPSTTWCGNLIGWGCKCLGNYQICSRPNPCPSSAKCYEAFSPDGVEANFGWQ